MRGPLIYSLKIGEKLARVDDTWGQNPDFPAWDVTPSTPWNYGLNLKTEQDLDAVKIETRPVTAYPWTPETAPVVLTVPARRIPSWQLVGPHGETPALPKAPIASEQIEPVQLIPYGATLLHLPVFPDLSGASSSKAAVTASAATTGGTSIKINSYTVSVPASKAHADTEPPSVLTDGKWANAAKQSLQYGKDVVVTAKLSAPVQVNEAVVYFYHFLTSMVDSIGVEISADGTTWESIATQKVAFSAQAGAGSPACELAIPVQKEAAYVRFTIKKTADSTRVLLGEIAVR